MVLLVTVLLPACTESREVLPGEGPVAQFVKQQHWLFVYGAAETDRSQLVDMTRFLPFKPGCSPQAAVVEFGPPDRKVPPEGGAEYVEYSNPHGRIRLGSEQSAYGPVAHPLYFFPTDRRPETSLSDVVLRRLSRSASREVVMLFECGYTQPFIQVILKGGQVQQLIWADTRDLIRRTSPTNCTD